jgi:hypothetical protein
MIWYQLEPVEAMKSCLWQLFEVLLTGYQRSQRGRAVSTLLILHFFYRCVRIKVTSSMSPVLFLENERHPCFMISHEICQADSQLA